MRRQLLVVEDDAEIAELVALHLGAAGHRVDRVADGEAALGCLADRRYDAVILDLGLPGDVDGLELCRRLRAHDDRTGVLMLTARSEEIDRVLGLELGADDYLTKPFSVRELAARLGAVLRRTELPEPEPDGALARGGLRIDPTSREVLVRGRRVELTRREFDLLLWFARRPGRVYTRAELLQQVWGYGHDGYAHTVNSHINRLRTKIEVDPGDPRILLTVWGVGYKFAENDASG
ncbi:MAG: response regulator transcription factor [Myxococcota bacterium]|nr:response regulator transcription factor [Myxococcota bacterium]